MTKQLVNLGTADKGNGDPLRVAFQKINGMFDELYAGGIGGASIVVSNTAPNNPVVGALWFNSTDGKLYIYYDNFWIDSNPVVDVISRAQLKEVVAASTSFEDFQTRIAAL